MSRGAVLGQFWLAAGDLDLLRGFYERALFSRPPDAVTGTSVFWTLGREGVRAVSFAIHADGTIPRQDPGGNLVAVFMAADLAETRRLILAEGGERIDPDPVAPTSVSRFVGMTVEQRFPDPEGNALLVYAWLS